MRRIRKLLFISFLYMSIIPIWSQQSPVSYIDSLKTQEISNTEKAIQMEDYLSSLAEETPNLEDAYYEYAKWSFVHNKDYEKAQLYGKKERDLRLKKYKATADKTKKNLYNLGYFYYKSKRPNLWTSKAYFDTLVSVSKDHEVRLGRAYRELGNIYNKWGDFQNALEHYSLSEQVFKEGEHFKEIVITLNNVLGLYMKLEDANYLEDFIETLEKLKTLDYIGISTSRQASRLYHAAAMYQIADSLEVAEKNAQEALSIYKGLNNRENIFKSLSLLGVIEIDKNNFNKARDYFKTSDTYAGDDKILLSNISNNLGDLELKSKNYEKAISHYYNAISWVHKGYISTIERQLPTQSEISISPDKKRLFGYLYDLSRAWVTYYDNSHKKEYLQKALMILELTDATIDELFLESQEEVSKLNWRKKASHVYMDAIKVAYLLNKPEIALYYMEKNKGLLLLENTTEVLAKQRANIPKTALKQEEIIQSSIRRYLFELGNTPTVDMESEATKALKKNLFSLKSQHRKFIDSIETLYPTYVNAKKQLQISSLKEIQKSLQPQEHIVNYALGDSLGYVMLVSKNEVQFKQIEISLSNLHKQIETFQQVLTRPFNTTQDITQYKKIATHLFNVLLPFNRFRESVSQKTLIVIPDGVIQKVPFEALTTSKNLEIPEAYLIYSNTIIYKYSHSLDEHITQLQPATNNTISFLPIHFKDQYLDSLPNSSKEAETINSYYQHHVYTEEKASKSFFLEHFDNNSIIHISTHGGTDINGPWIAFYDDRLRLEELYSPKRRKELVVLSACKTDVGDIKKGEGVFSIKRGFFKAGARSVVSTLWDVNEKANMEIMTTFYNELSKGKTKSEALRIAKISYIKQHKNTSEASPYYWSGITLTGHDNTVDLKSFSYMYLWILLIIIIGFLLYYSLLRKKS